MNKISGYSLFLFFLLILASCVPNTRYVPLQNGDVNARNLPLDTIVRVRNFSFKEYRIKPGDQLSVNIETLTPDEYNFVKQLNPATGAGGMMTPGLFGYLVDKNGQIQFPVLGYVKLQGLTMLEAETHMKSLLMPLLKDPIVRIRIMNYRFIFAGEVSGIVTAPTPRMSLLEAVTMAGGFTELSDRQNIKIIRQNEDKAEIFYVNLLEEEFLSSPNFWLEQNDIVIIRPLRQRTTRQYLVQNIGFFLSLTTLVVSAANLISR